MLFQNEVIMAENIFFTPAEAVETKRLYKEITVMPTDISSSDRSKVKSIIKKGILSGRLSRNVFGMNPVTRELKVVETAVGEMGLRRPSLLAVMLREPLRAGIIDFDYVEKEFGDDVAKIIRGLVKINKLYDKTPVIESENFRNLLLSLAEDMRVILIMIADRVNIMRGIRDTDAVDAREKVAAEASFLYAPIAHKLGLYKLKSELEDLSLKYLEHDVYYFLKDKLNATKRARDRYILEFVEPVEKKLKKAGIRSHIKGRTKTIHSIYQKMKKQNCAFENVYDLFAIRIIIDAPDNHELERQLCWQAYSIVTDMYKPNPRRLRDWLSVPKSNGYESLHTTVMGPGGKWVEIQIRTERMDAVAERGLAAHWRYKGLKSEGGLDDWLRSVREALEESDTGAEAMSKFKLELYEDEVFVFTPHGDLFKLPCGATVLDFAFSIHTHLGCTCTGGRVNGRIVPIKQKLKSGDQVEIMTSDKQKPKLDWLDFVHTSKAKTKIRQAVKEQEASRTEYAREELERRFRNRKVDYDDSLMMRFIKKMKYKNATNFYHDIAEGKLDTGRIVEEYQNFVARDESDGSHESAGSFSMKQDDVPEDDVLVIGKGVKGLDFSLAPCCNPVFGDDVFGFVSVTGGIKIHRENCPNAKDMKTRFPYRIVKARWSGRSVGKKFPIRLRIVGNDDISIVTNITSIINKEPGVSLRSISVDSDDGLFTGMLTLMVEDTKSLDGLIQKMKDVKGVKRVAR